MEPNKILKSDFLDILFEKRNKVYGAYELRRSYDKRIIKALCITGATIVLIMGTTLMAKPTTDDNIVVSNNDGIVIQEIQEEVVVKQVEPPPPVIEKPIEPPQIQTIAFLEPVVTNDDLVIKDPPAQDDLDGIKIDDLDRDGVKGLDDISIPPPSINKIQIIEEKVTTDEPWSGPIEVEAEYIGGPREWEKFLRRNLVPEVPVDNNAAPGRYTVYIQFIVDREGNVSDMKPLTAHGFGMEQEAIRVLRKATKWKPANQNGRAVKAYRKQPITFVVADQ